MAKPLIIGSLLFTTKAAAIAHMKALLNGPPLDSLVREPGHTFLVNLVALHPDATVKIGCGVSHFTIEQNAYAQRGFRLHRLDGSSTDFSVYTCFDGKYNRKAQVQLALRTATMHQVSNFRDQQLMSGPVLCPFSGEVLTRENSHVDHESPSTFEALSQGWMVGLNLTFETVAITESADNKQGREMNDPFQVASWQTFHAAHAKLRLVSIRANLSNAKLVHNRSR